MNKYKIPQKVIRRMSGYYRILKDMESTGENKVYSRQLGETMGCAASQVRQDFSFFGNFGTTGQGYALEGLRKSVGKVLGVDRRHSAILVGVGHIGSYLLENKVFQDSGFDIVAAFDISPAVIGRELNGLVVRDSEDMEAFLKETEVTMAALCLPGYSAQEAAELLCTHGVMAIWNVTGCDLELPRGVVLEELSISDSFLSLSYHLAQRHALRSHIPAGPYAERSSSRSSAALPIAASASSLFSMNESRRASAMVKATPNTTGISENRRQSGAIPAAQT